MLKDSRKSVVLALAGFAVIAILIYFIARSLLFLYSAYTGIEKVSAVLLISSELFVLLHGLGYVLNIINATSFKGNGLHFKAVSFNSKPPVAILVAARHEPKEVIENTILTINNIDYPNKELYFLDDSSDERYMKEADELSRKYNFKIFRRALRRGAKAGIINDCIKGLNHKYVVIFDADQNPLPNFLNVLIPIMEDNDKLAFTQTPQFYTNIDKNRVARAAAFQQAVFYEYICEGKSSREAMFCCGTNVIFRLKALLAVNGLDESTVTEDFATSLKLHSAGWSSLYYNHVYAFGMGPNNILGYFKQQFRWAAGTITVLKKLVLLLILRPFSLSFSQWWEYFLSGSYYLVGVAFFFLMVCPLAYLLFNVPSFFASQSVYLFTYLPYIILTTSVFYNVLRKRNYTIQDLFLGQLLGACTFPVYLSAGICALFGFKVTFGITEKNNGTAASYAVLWPQILFIFINIIALTWGLNRFIYERDMAILVNSFWVLYHTAVLSGIFYFNRDNK